MRDSAARHDHSEGIGPRVPRILDGHKGGALPSLRAQISDCGFAANGFDRAAGADIGH